jgi:hypothetical protein
MYEAPEDGVGVATGEEELHDADLDENLADMETGAAVRVRANKFLNRIQRLHGNKLRGQRHRRHVIVDGPRSRLSHAHYTKDGRLKLGQAGAGWSTVDRMRQYRKDIKEEETIIAKLKSADDDLIEKSFDYCDELEVLMQSYQRLMGEKLRLRRMRAFEEESRSRLAKQIDELRHRCSTQHGLHLIERERYNKRVDDFNALEKRLLAEHKKDQAGYDERCGRMHEQMVEAVAALEEHRSLALEADTLAKDSRERIAEHDRMSESLAQAESGQLHEAINAAATAARRAELRLTRVIAHLQKELQVTNEMADELQAEQNVLREELGRADQKNRILARELKTLHMKETQRADGEEATTEEEKRLAERASALADEELSPRHVSASVRVSRAELKDELEASAAEKRDLEEALERGRREHATRMTSLAESLGKETRALLHYAHDLEHTVRGGEAEAEADRRADEGDAANEAPPEQHDFPDAPEGFR